MVFCPPAHNDIILELIRNAKISSSTPDSLNQNLHFNKIQRWVTIHGYFHQVESTLQWACWKLLAQQTKKQLTCIAIIVAVGWEVPCMISGIYSFTGQAFMSTCYLPATVLVTGDRKFEKNWSHSHISHHCLRVLCLKLPYLIFSRALMTLITANTYGCLALCQTLCWKP